MNMILALRDKIIVVTRPQQQAQELCQLINMAGGKAYPAAPLAIHSLIDQSNQFQIIEQTLRESDSVIFVSQNAVYPLQSILNSFSLESPAQFFATGKHTAKVLQQAGIKTVIIPAEDNQSSEGLLRLPQFQHSQNKKIAIFCGAEANPQLFTTLTARGAIVTTHEVYRRIPCALPTLPKKVDAIICTSLEILQAFCQQCPYPHWFSEVIWVVISQKMLLHAKNLGLNTVVLAANASNEATLTALITHWSKT